MKRPYFLSCENACLTSASDDWCGVDGLCFTLMPGSLVVVRGDNGSGKTNLLEMLARDRALSSGTLTYGDLAVKEGEDKPHKVLFIKETDGVQLNKKVYQMLRLYAKKCDNSATVNAAVKYFQLEPLLSQKCKDISEGYRRRVLLSQLLFSQSKLWLLDDPFKGLDEDAASLVQALVQARTEQGGCVVMTTQSGIANPNVGILNMNDFQIDSAER